MVPELIGREREMGIVDDLVGNVKERGGALVVTGEAGIGKSSLLSKAERFAQDRGMRVLQTTGVQSEAHLPFAGLHQLLRPILSGADDLPTPQREALRAAFGMTEAATPDLFLVALGTLNLLVDAATDSGLVAIAEDAQWLDRSTNEVLAFVGRRLESDPIALLIAIRDGYESSLAEAGLPELRLRGLAEAAAGEVLLTNGHDLSPQVRARILEEAAGNPLALVELPIALRSEQLTGGSSLPARLPLTERLEGVFAARATDLPESTRIPLLVAAVDDGDDLGEVLTAAAIILGSDPGVDTLKPAVASRLIEVDETKLRFRHPLIRSAICQSAGLSERQAAHAALADVLTEHDRRAWHRAASTVGTDERAASDLQAAAENARRRGAIGVAVAALERAAELTEDTARRRGRLLEAAELAVDLGRREVVVRLTKKVDPVELSPLDAGRMAWIREMSEPGPLGDPATLRSLVETAERMSAEGDVNLASKLLWAAANSGFWAGRDDVTSTLVVEAAGRVLLDDDPMLLSILAYAASIERGADVIEGVSRRAPDPSDPLAMDLLGNAAATVGAFDLSEPFATASAAGLREQGRLTLLAQVLVLRAWAEIHLGRWDAARSDAEEAVRLALETGQPIWGTGAKVALSILAGLRGDEAEAEMLALEVESVALPFGARAVMCVVQLARGLTALGAGRHDDAYQHLRRMFDPADPSHHPMESCWAIGNLAEAAVHSGHRDEARAVMRALEPLAAKTPSTWFHVAMRHARPLLADDDHAEELFQSALDANLTRWPFDRARAQLAYGAWLRRQRRVAESRVPLRSARDAFDALGVAAWGARARLELRASGETSHERTPAAGDLLTAQELQIAHMAAQGLTNREIGQRLYLSHRTVGSHLYRIFPKLGIASRTQLVTVLDRDASPA